MPQEKEPTLLNKNFLRTDSDPSVIPALSASSKSADVAVDEALEKVNNNFNPQKRNYKFLRKVFAFIFAIIVIGTSAYLLINWRSGPDYIESKSSQTSTSRFAYYDLDKPSKLANQVADLDLEDVEAVSIYAFNPNTYQTFASENIEEKRKIASLTKLVTAVVALKEFEYDDILEMKEDFPEEVSNGIGLNVGDKMTLETALNLLLVSSKNDVAMFIAQNDSEGYEGFVKKMNETAEMLGMYDSSFANPMGYDDVNNYSTASDLKKLSLHILTNENILLIVDKPAYQGEITNKDGVIRTVEVKTTNELLEASSTVHGLKTGYTAGAGACFIGYFAGEDDDQLITIVLGVKEDRFEETMDLFKSINDAYID